MFASPVLKVLPVNFSHLNHSSPNKTVIYYFLCNKLYFLQVFASNNVERSYYCPRSYNPPVIILILLTLSLRVSKFYWHNIRRQRFGYVINYYNIRNFQSISISTDLITFSVKLNSLLKAYKSWSNFYWYFH